MADTFREGRLRGEPSHRVDEIHVHRQRRSIGLLLALLALIAIGLIAFWASRRDRDVEIRREVGIPRLDEPLETAARATPEVPARSEREIATPEAASRMTPQASPPAGSDPGVAAAPGSPPREAPAPAKPDAPCAEEVVLHFTSNASKLREAELPQVENIAACMKADPEMTVRLEGRTDSSGESDPNRALALGRAQTVKQRLVELGVPESKLTVVVREPECEEATAACWQKNRSVTVVSRR